MTDELDRGVAELAARSCVQCESFRCTWMMMYRMKHRASAFWTRSGSGFKCREYRRCGFLAERR